MNAAAPTPARASTTTARIARFTGQIFSLHRGCSRTDPAAPVEEVLQDHGRGSGVQLRFALPPVALADGKAALGLATRQAFVLRVDRRSCQLPQFADERL